MKSIVLPIFLSSYSLFAFAGPAVVEHRVVPTQQVGSGNTIYVPVPQNKHRPAVSSNNSGGMGVLLGKVNRLQSEVQELRGQVELLTFEIQQIKQNQKDRYLDLDSRINQLSSGSGRSANHAAQTSPTTGDVEGVAVAKNPALEQNAYDAAFALLKQKNYAAAEKAFDGFLLDFPNGNYADNAQYWLGETRYVQNNMADALTAFNRLVEQFPASTKRPGAELKIAYIYAATGKTGEAKKRLRQIQKDYPGSTTARFAKKKLSELTR